MSSSTSRTPFFSIAPFSLSNNLYFSIEEYDHKQHSKRSRLNQKSVAPSTSNSLFSIDPIDGPLHVSLQADDSSSIDNNSITKPLAFKRVPRQVSEKRFNFLCSDRQLLCDLNKSRCANLCLSTYGKSRLRVVA